MLRVNEVLKGIGDNYILPFLWLHGESHPVLKEEIEMIEACGIREICIESRPHPDFMGAQWWADLDFIMEEARKRKMRVWILDDDKFPTGHANGVFAEQPDKKKIYLAKRQMDLIGPVDQVAVLIENFLGADGKLLAVFVCKRMNSETLSLDIEHAFDVTKTYKDGMVYFDIPTGFHRLIVLFTTQNNGGREDYINLIDDISVQVLIDEVYEGHYNRYKDDFGKTFAGFFSDEPELGNVLGYGFDELIGKKDRHLPWSSRLQEKLEEIWTDDRFRFLIGLWYDVGNKTKSIRKSYMDQVTYLVDQCFTGKIGEWCKQRKVEYIGHVIEDDNAHTRMGCSIGHYFRAQKGQHMAGIDLVHLQLIPGFTEKYHQWIAGDQDGEFFHFGLAKLASSSARLDSNKKGRSLCELFGSYGWAEGVGLMKWLADHMLVRGINHFVPHAFSPMYPDRDCPPHFYARGNNPQYPYIVTLMQHMNRIAHLLSGGSMNAGIGVLYHAEAEWTGGSYEPYQKIVRSLLESQLDCTVIASEYLAEDKVIFSIGCFVINELKYDMLLIPYSEYINDEVVSFVERSIQWKIPVYTTVSHPKETISGVPLPKSWFDTVAVINTKSIANCVKEQYKAEIEVQTVEKALRACSYCQQDGVVYLFFNEHPFNHIDTIVHLRSAVSRRLIRYDSIKNKLEEANFSGDRLRLRLAPGESACYFFDMEDMDNYGTIQKEWSYMEQVTELQLEGEWKISVLETGVSHEFIDNFILRKQDELPFINHLDSMTRFSGIIRYESQFCLEELLEMDEVSSSKHYCNDRERRMFLELQGISDAVTVHINDDPFGQILSAPYSIDITDVATKVIKLKVDVVNTLTWRLHDGQSTHTQLKSSGMTKRPLIKVYRK